MNVLRDFPMLYAGSLPCWCYLILARGGSITDLDLFGPWRLRGRFSLIFILNQVSLTHGLISLPFWAFTISFYFKERNIKMRARHTHGVSWHCQRYLSVLPF